MKYFRKAFLGLLTAFLLLLTIEGIAWIYALGVSDLRVPPLPSPPKYDVLCSWGQLQRLCPDRGPEYERVRPEVFTQKAERKRIVFIGESFVYGLGITAQEAFPKQVGDSLGVEALNFGRCGTYASRLVPIVEAAVMLEPDLIVLATGNNEHTMTSFFSGSWGRRPLRNYRILQFLGQFQSYGALSRLIGTGDLRIQESFEREKSFLEADIDKKVFAARRRPPDLSVFEDALADYRVRAVLEEEQRLKELIFADQLQHMVDIVQAAQIPILLTTLPQKAFIPPALSGTQRKDKRTILEARNKRDIQQGLLLDSSVAFFHFEQAEQLWRQGKRQEAIEAYERSISLDLVPDSTPEINAIIAEVAVENNIPLVDLRARAWQYAGHPQSFFLDSVHLNAQGAKIVGEWLTEDIRSFFPERFP